MHVSLRKLGLVYVLGSLLFSSVAYADSMKVGTVINHVLSTDIKAYVSDYQIPSMNIDGSTAIIAEDLRNYGFTVIWNPDSRMLDISYNPDASTFDPLAIPESLTSPVGTRIKDVLYTDIKTNLNGKEIPSFNIGGLTAIYLKDLSSVGNVSWDEMSKKALFDFVPHRVNVDKGISYGSIYIVKNKSTAFTVNYEGREIKADGSIIGYVDQGASFISVKYIGNKIGYKVDYNRLDNSILVDSGSYYFKLKEGSESASLFYNNDLITTVSLTSKPVLNSAEETLYVNELDLESLFGLAASWDTNHKAHTYSFKDYYVDNLVLPDHTQSSTLDIGIVNNDDDNISSYPKIEIVNKSVKETESQEQWKKSGFSHSNLFEYTTKSHLQLIQGANSVSVTVTLGNRILYEKKFIVYRQ